MEMKKEKSQALTFLPILGAKSHVLIGTVRRNAAVGSRYLTTETTDFASHRSDSNLAALYPLFDLGSGVKKHLNKSGMVTMVLSSMVAVMI